MANSFLKSEAVGTHEPIYPLRVLFCVNCGLCQLGEVVDPEILFRDYVYFSSGMPSSPHYRAYAEEVAERFVKSSDDLVVEIGSNDGHLLREIQKKGVTILGVDPARNIAMLATANGIETIPEFFGEQIGKKIREDRGSARVIIGNNVVAHIDDHHGLMAGIIALLADDGVFILEAPYLVDMVENLTFDTIYHEHLSYLAVRPLQHLFAQYGMEIFDVKIFPVQGYSLRVYAGKKRMHPISSSVHDFLQKEYAMGLDTIDAYYALRDRIFALKNDVRAVVLGLKQEGKRIACYGAPAKGNTLLNFFNINTSLVDFATEELPSKIGLFAPGMHIPVISIEEARKNYPDYFLLLAWNYKDVIVEKEKEFRERGGKFIMPIGEERLV